MQGPLEEIEILKYSYGSLSLAELLLGKEKSFLPSAEVVK